MSSQQPSSDQHARDCEWVRSNQLEDRLFTLEESPDQLARPLGFL